MTYSERVKRSALIVLVGMVLMVLVATILAGMGYNTGLVIGAGGIVIALCIAALAVARSRSREKV